MWLQGILPVQQALSPGNMAQLESRRRIFKLALLAHCTKDGDMSLSNTVNASVLNLSVLNFLSHPFSVLAKGSSIAPQTRLA